MEWCEAIPTMGAGRGIISPTQSCSTGWSSILDPHVVQILTCFTPSP